ncbi:MAG: 2Fe-2S iron-sulfur cluster-binding protein [Pseudomonadota bacterium]
MAKITYIEHDGTTIEVDVNSGTSVMEGGVNNGVDGVVAECGGGCACATCHCYIDEAWLEIVGPPNEIEADMLEFAFEPKDNSRLSCQIEVTDDLDGLVVRLPSQQGA